MRFLGFRRHSLDESDLSAYIDEALSDSRRGRVEAHLRSCGDCARRLEELKQVVAELRALPPAKAPRSFALSPELAAVSQRQGSLATEERRRAARRAYLGLSGATVAAALLLVAAFGTDLFVVSSGGQPTSLPAATSSDKSLSMPQAAAALPATTVPGYPYANQPGAENQGSGQIAVPPATPTGGQSGTGTASSGQLVPPPAVPLENQPGTAATASAPTDKNALSTENPGAAATANALSEKDMLPSASPRAGAAAPSSEGAPAGQQEAQPAEKSASHAWLWALEGAAGGLFIGFGLSAFWMRRRWIRINRDS